MLFPILPVVVLVRETAHSASFAFELPLVSLLAYTCLFSPMGKLLAPFDQMLTVHLAGLKDPSQSSLEVCS